jgi:hypothetical protein
LALSEIREGYALLPSNAHEEIRRDKLPRAAELLESAIKRVDDYEALRSKAWNARPILFTDLAYLRAKAQKGLVLIAFVNLVEPGQQGALVMHLNHLIMLSEPTLEIISHDLQSRSPDSADIADILARYRGYEEELADFIAQAYMLLGAESRRAGDIAGARVHWQRSLKFARADEIKSLVEEKLQELKPLTGTDLSSSPPLLKPPVRARPDK